AKVSCNRHRLKQVLTNLLRNAAKHGCDPERPRIVISSVADTIQAADTVTGGLVAIRVHDNGPGIAPEFHEEIFLPGRRLPETSSDGSGMGLPIVKKIVESYGGTVSVDSGQEAGTAFVVTLPSSFEGARESRAPSGLSVDSGTQTHPLDRDSLDTDHRLQPHRPLPRRPGPRGGP
ncbi:MAG: ATP-binding protein, partial [Planctomycetes bacterium]|nr:ATP-binding protein [Planctomycetota bacterium]